MILPSSSPSFAGEAWFGPLLRASNEIWFIWSISSIWLVEPETHPEEPDRP